MTCAKCHNHWCWICNAKMRNGDGGVEEHYTNTSCRQFSVAEEDFADNEQCSRRFTCPIRYLSLILLYLSLILANIGGWLLLGLLQCFCCCCFCGKVKLKDISSVNFFLSSMLGVLIWFFSRLGVVGDLATNCGYYMHVFQGLSLHPQAWYEAIVARTL